MAQGAQQRCEGRAGGGRCRVDVVVLVPSVFLPECTSLGTARRACEAGAARRRHVRAQWARSLRALKGTGATAELLFVRGDRDQAGAPLPVGAAGAAEGEAAAFRDVLSCPARDVDVTMEDAEHTVTSLPPSSTTVKMLRGIQYVVGAYDFAFLVRSGDDAYFNVREFLHIAPRLPRVRLHMGRFFTQRINGDEELTDDMQRAFGSSLIPFAAGMGYVLSHDVCAWIRAMANAGVPLRMHAPEDVVVSAWVYGLDIARVNDHRFHDVAGRGEFPSMCQPNDILVHHMQGEDWSNIGDDGILQCEGTRLHVNFPPPNVQRVPVALYYRGQNWEFRPPLGANVSHADRRL